MKLDIILITYNQEQYIAQAVKSILMQRVNDDVQVRVIVADDCSKDKTLEIIKSYEEKSPFPFTYLPIEDNMGHVRNYQRAFAACVGDYVAILEGDDYWTSPIHIQIQVDFLEQHYECVLTTTTPLILNEKGEFSTWHYDDVKDDVTMYTSTSFLAKNMIINMSAIIIRNSILKQISDKIYTVSLLDWVLYIALGEFGVLTRLKTMTSVYRLGIGVWENQLHAFGKTMLLEEYDMALGYKYHEQLMRPLSQEVNPRKTLKLKIKSYIPPLVIELYRLLVPPFIKHK